MKKLLLFFLAVLAVGRVGFAAVETFSERREAGQLVVSATPLMNVYDDKYMTMTTNPSWSSLFTNYKVRNVLRLGINPDVAQTNDLSGSITFDLRLWKWVSGAFVISTETRTLSLSYTHSSPTALVNEIASYAFEGAHRVEVTITSITGGASFDVNDVFVSAEIAVDRYYAFDGTAVSGLGIATAADNANYYEFNWNYKTGAEFYELEWVHVSDAKMEGGSYRATSELKYNYYLNSTRIIVYGNSYRIPKIFDHGYLLYRIRAVGLIGTHFDVRKEGAWTNTSESGTVAGHVAANREPVTADYDPGMNWQHAVRYTEGGRRFESVSFLDGLGRGRQMVVHNTETKQAIVSNIYYDELSRAVVSDLPTPEDGEVLKHKNGFNKADANGLPFQAAYFDNPLSPACDPQAAGFSTSSGAGKYYSPGNPDQDGENVRIPNAEKYPYARVTFTNDFTGRIASASGFGEDLKTGSGHEMKFAYPSANQAELTRLFGAEVGNASHYTKLVTIDQNGQVYVKYIDMSGRTVAAFLAGESPASLDAVEGNGGSEMTVSILPQNAQNIDQVMPSSTLTYSDYIYADASYVFDYAFTPEQFQNVCMPETFCLDCVYDLEFRIIDERCGEVIFEHLGSLIGKDLDFACTNKPEFAYVSEPVELEQGSYVIVKKLSVNQQSIEDNWCAYIDNATCLESVDDRFNELYAAESFIDCQDDVISTIDEGPCDGQRAAMLQDLTPGGQYAGFNNTSGVYTPLTAAANVHSVLTLNSLGTNNDWKHPVTPYLNADGSVAAINSILSTVSFQQFVSSFQASWAESLLPFHPEYCFLQFCESSAMQDSYEYEQEMLKIYTYTDACAAGFIQPLTTSQDPSPFPCTTPTPHYDPFFQSGGYGAGMLTTMKLETDDYLGSGYSIWENAVYEAMCNGEGSIVTCLADFDRLNNKDCYWDLIWVTYRSLYLELKASKVYAAMHSQSGCSNDHIGVNANWIDNTPIWGNLAMLPDADGDGFPETGTGLTDVEFGSYLDGETGVACETACEDYADEWLGLLSECEEIAALTTPQRDALRDDLIDLCMSGCNSDHPMGSSTAPPGYSGPYSTIDEVLVAHLGAGYEDELCTSLLISEPGPYQSTEELYGLVTSPLDTCACNIVLTAQWNIDNGLNPNNYNLEQMVASVTGVSLEDAHFIICACDMKLTTGGQDYDPNQTVWLPVANSILETSGFGVPSELSCTSGNGCTDCETVNDIIAHLNDRFEDVDDFESVATYPTILTNYLNNELHFTLGYSDYAAFIGKCQATTDAPYCTVNPLANELMEVLTLQAYRGMLVTSGTPIALLDENIVYANGELQFAMEDDNYWGEIDGEVLNVYIGHSEPDRCPVILSLPDDADFGFSDIVSFGQVLPVTTDCSNNIDFQVIVQYIDCGQLKSALLDGRSGCFEVNECVCSAEGLTLCDELPSLESVCYQPRLNELYQDALNGYFGQVQSLYTEYQEEYRSACAAAFNSEALSYSGPNNTYQYVLFFYDQAGNLARTVAPEGIPATFDDSYVDDANNSVVNFTTYTAPGTFPSSPFPDNSFVTRYSYNSYDQLVSATNPDQQGATNYWYDRYGRIVLSQNPVQADDKKYTYMLYDALDRIVETGQIDRDVPPGGGGAGYTIAAITESKLKTNDKGTAFKDWVYDGVRTEVTYTVYDKTISPLISSQFNGGQQNLRLRVASVVYFDAVGFVPTMPTSGYTSATHYSYDVHGNVIETLQDVPELAPVFQDVKSTQYDFELLSGNMKKVDYQSGQRDQLLHEYTYDKLNRISEVYTSTDGGVHRSREAHYRYFDYGPVSRVEIGQHKVQGNDYTYTINGWLKGMNSATLNRTRDGGRDGASGYLAANPRVNELFARDVVGYTMGYFQGDYQSIGTTTFEADPFALNSSVMNDLGQAIRGLYNGNIAHTVSAIADYEVQAGVYNYDQLNRLTRMRVFRNNSLGTSNTWSAAYETDEYASVYTYSRNGNLKTLSRNGTTTLGLSMDDFDYKYAADANRLIYVTDAPNGATINYLEDINDGQTGVANQPITASQASNNYQYDKLGQLVKDVQEGIQTLEWRKGDKKLKMQKSLTKQLEFVYNPLGLRVMKIEKAVSGGSVVPQSTTPWKYTYYSYNADGEVMAVYEVRMDGTVNTALLSEQTILGASRIGLIQAEKTIYTNQSTLPDEGPVWINQLGKKNYELTNHLGNVNAVITDRKMVTQNVHVNFTDLFDVNDGGWISSTHSSKSVSGGQLVVNTVPGGLNYVYKPISLVAGEEYTIAINVSFGTAPGLNLHIPGGIHPLNNGTTTYVTFTAPGTGSYSMTVRPTASTGSYTFYIQDATFRTHAKYTAVVVMKADYYPFGMAMPARNMNLGDYRFGYNGMEMDNDLKGNGNSYTTEFRQYDPRLGRWLSLDPLMTAFPWLSPYAAFDNNPIFYVDPYGLSSSQGGDTYVPEGAPSNPHEGSYYYSSKDDMEYIYEDGKWVAQLDEVVIKPPTDWLKLGFDLFEAVVDNVVGNGCLLPTWRVEEPKSIFEAASKIGEALGLIDADEYVMPSEYPSPSSLEYEIMISESGYKGPEPEEEMTWSEVGHTALEVVGFIPVVGEIADGIDAIWYACEGDYVNAGISAASMIPFAGWVPAGARMGKKLVGVVIEEVEQKAAKEVTQGMSKRQMRREARKKCFVAGTLIHTQMGLIPIENLSVGDSVWSYDVLTGEVALKPIASYFVRTSDHLRVIVIDNDTIFTTDEHPFFVNGEFLEAKHIVAGDTLQLRDGTLQWVESVFRKDTVVTVYNFEVADFHTYYVSEDGVLVHNKGKQIRDIPRAGPGKQLKKDLNSVKRGEISSHDTYRGEECPDWAGAEEFYTPSSPAGSGWRILKQTRPDGSVRYGWSKDHYKHITEF